MIRHRLVALGIGAVATVAALALMGPTGGFPSRPRFQTVGVGVAPASTAGTINAESGSYNDTTAPAYRATATAGASLIATPRATDAIVGTTSAHSLLLVTSGAARMTIASTGGINIPGTATFGSAPAFQNGTTAAQLNSTAPRLLWDDTDAGADQRLTYCSATGTSFQCGTRTDADGAGQDWLAITRSGTTVSTVNIPNGSAQVGGVLVPTHRVVETATSGAAMRVGDTFTVSKSADTSRTSTAVSAVDGDLQITSLPAGHYIIDLYLRFTMGAGGWRYQWDAPDTGQVLVGVRECNGTVAAELHVDDTDVTCAGASGDDYVMVSGGSAKLMSTGTVSISWAQNTSNAAATTLQSDSYLRVTRID